MEQINALRALLLTFPLWGQQPLFIDSTDASPECCGLFPLGLRELERREDVLGGCRQRLRQTFLLRRHGCRGEDAAAWLLQLQQWLMEQADVLQPVFGTQLQLRAEQGKLTSTAQPGTGVYEVQITVEYTKEKEYGEN